jgi:hypothetical protein
MNRAGIAREHVDVDVETSLVRNASESGLIKADDRINFEIDFRQIDDLLDRGGIAEGDAERGPIGLLGGGRVALKYALIDGINLCWRVSLFSWKIVFVGIFSGKSFARTLGMPGLREGAESGDSRLSRTKGPKRQGPPQHRLGLV